MDLPSVNIKRWNFLKAINHTLEKFFDENENEPFDVPKLRSIHCDIIIGTTLCVFKSASVIVVM